MQLWLKLLIIVIILLSGSSLLWFLIGSTGYLQRGMDIVGTTYLLYVGVPVLMFAIVFAGLLIKGWFPTSGVHYVGTYAGLIIAILLSSILINSVFSNGWIEEKIDSDSLQTTVDGKYEYQIELINLFQRNSKSRLYLRDTITGEEKIIPVNIQTRKIVVLGMKAVNHWIKLEPSDKPFRYFLYTTEDLGISSDKFIIDIEAGTSSRLE